MKQRNSLCHIIPSVSDLLDTKISDKNLNVDDGLSAQNDENLFLIASMVFLQKHLKRKLGQEEEESEGKKRMFSDMLLFETKRGGDKERFYIRLKNIEKFDGIKQSEICVPKSALSTEQILPVPKKPKLCFSRIFRAKSKKNLKGDNVKKTKFNLFKKNKDIFNPEEEKPSILVLNNGECRSNFSLTSDWTRNIKARAARPDEDLLKLLPSLNKFSLKNSPSQNFRSRSSLTSFDTVYNFDNAEVFSSVYSLDSDIESIPAKKHLRGKVRQQQSKLSVCLEDESESENEFTRISSKISYNNFPDEVKANLSPEVLQSIVSQMILYLEERPEEN